MHIEDSEHRYIRKNVVKTARDIEVNKIISHIKDLSFDITYHAASPDIIVLVVEEGNHHKEYVEILDDKIRVCTCSFYRKEQLGTCKHLEIIKAVQNSQLTQEEAQFAKFLKKNIAALKSRKSQIYSIYDSKDNCVLNIGSGSVFHTLNYTKYLGSKINTTSGSPVTLPTPYVLSPSITLYDYQKTILEKMLTVKKAICSMVMGAGKTLCSVGGLKYLNTNNVLIVCPKSVMKQWEKEIKRVLRKDSIQIQSSNIDDFLLKEQIGIVTYQTFARNYEKLSSKGYEVIIADEIQYIRNDESKVWKAFSHLKSTYFWGLSGTVIENRLDDLYNITEIINPDYLGPKWKFDDKFKVMKSIHKQKVLYENKVQNLPELRSLTEGYVFSYDKLVLPGITYGTTYCSLSKEAKKYHDTYNEKAAILISKSLNTPLSFKEKALLQSYLLKCRQACNTPELIDGTQCSSDKIDKIVDFILGKIQIGQKIAVYSEWTTMLSIIERYMDKHKIKYSRFDGSLSSITRLKRIEEFQNDPDCSVFFSSDAGGIGIDGLQTICNTIIHTELPWNPAKLDQRNGRLHRIGQTKNVEVHNFVTTDSIETKIEELLINKKKVRMDTLYNVEIQE
jgi:SNF2 family DNA or RNA helicase